VDWKTTLSQAKAVSDKARQLIEAEAREASEVAGKATRVSQARVQTLLDDQWPRVQRLFTAVLQKTAGDTLHDDKRMRRILLLVFGELPMLVRVAVEEDEFIAFCLNNRNRLLLREEVGLTVPPEQVEPESGGAAQQGDEADER
jgi:hypothetical protein